MPQEYSVGVVVASQKKPRTYLLLHYASGHWEFPRGNIEREEYERTTAARECKEETGIAELDFVEGFREVAEWFYRRDGKTIHKEAVYLLATTDQAKVTLSHEHQGYVWLPFGEALERTTFENAKEVLRKAEKRLKKELNLKTREIRLSIKKESSHGSDD